MTKLSIIVPVYNAESYIKRMINSIFNQKLERFEIILVNDGSTDNSPYLCDELACEYENIKVVHKKNAGVSAARNDGIKRASGEYITFADVDDEYCGTKMKEWVDGFLESEADMAVCSFNYVHEKYTVVKHVRFEGCISKEILCENIDKYILGDMNNVWNKIFKRSIIRENNIAFPPTKIGEDAVFAYKYLKHCENVYFFDEAIYNYFQNSGSAMHNYYKKRTDDEKIMLDRIIDFMDCWQINSEKAENIIYVLRKNLILSRVNNLVMAKSGMNFAEKKSELLRITDGISNTRWEEIQKKAQGKVQKISIYLIKNKLYRTLFLFLHLKSSIK